MNNCFSFLKGSFYRNIFFYNLVTLVKFGRNRYSRYKIASQYIEGAKSVLDICAGEGKLRDFLPRDMGYTAVDAGESFIEALSRKKISSVRRDIHWESLADISGADVIVMIISLYQFRKTSIDRVLEEFKCLAPRVVIVEEVLEAPDREDSMFRRLVNFLCMTPYYVPVGLFSLAEFEAVMRRHGYACCLQGRYCVGLYDSQKNKN